MAEPRTFATLRKGNSEEIRVRLAELEAGAFVDIRSFVPLRRTGGEPVPTKAGICIAKSRLRELIAGLQAIEREGGGA